MKKYLFLFTIIFTLLILSACQSFDALSQFERTASSSIEMTKTLDAIEEQDVKDQDVNQLSASNVVLLSSVSINMTDQEKIVSIQALFSSIKILHAQNVLLFEANKVDFLALRENIRLFRDQNFELTQEDRTTILEYRNQVRDSRLDVMETQGMIKDLLVELRGNFNLEHLDLVLSNFQEILEILQLRNDHLSLVQDTIVSVNSIVASYLA